MSTKITNVNFEDVPKITEEESGNLINETKRN